MLSRNLRRFKLVTFDCTNTLLYFKQPVNEQYLQVALEMGHRKDEFDETKIMPSFKKHFKEMKEAHPNFGRTTVGYEHWWSNIVQNVLSDATMNSKKPEEFEKVAERLISLYETRECWSKHSGADELIRSLRHHGKLVGIISNFDPRIHKLLRDMHLYKHFDFIITSYEAKVEKPDYKIFELALNKSLGITWDMMYPNQALHVGNELDKDYQGAINAGWSSVLISKEIKCKNCYNTLKEFFESINSQAIEL